MKALDKKVEQLRQRLKQLLELTEKAKTFNALVKEFELAGLSSSPVPTKEQMDTLKDLDIDLTLIARVRPDWLYELFYTLNSAATAPTCRAVAHHRIGKN
jgi:hypothetical protein